MSLFNKNFIYFQDDTIMRNKKIKFDDDMQDIENLEKSTNTDKKKTLFDNDDSEEEEVKWNEEKFEANHKMNHQVSVNN